MASEDEEEDWTQYASAGYGDAYDPWADLVPIEEGEKNLEEELDLDDGEFFSLRPPPAEEGFDQLVKMGCCDYCITRLAGRSFTWDNCQQIGAGIRSEVEGRGFSVADDVEYCPFCEDLFVEMSILTERIGKQLDGIEFKKIQIGTHFSKDQITTEDELRTRFGATGAQALKAAFNDSLAYNLSTKYGDIELVKDLPEIMVLVDTLTFQINAEIRSLYLYGRYRKLERGIPQTRWPCRVCKGRDGGCESCEETGLQYPTSVQDQIGEPLRAAYQAKETAFHGMGREDIDVRCLGRGRPFVIEMKSPLRRYADLSEMTELVNVTSNGRVEITELRASRRSEVARIKGTAAEKSYTIRFKMGPEPHVPLITENGKETDSKGSDNKAKSAEKSEKDALGTKSDEKTDSKASVDEDVGGPSETPETDTPEEEQTSENDSTTTPIDWTDEQIVEHIASLVGVTLAQQTPQRVAHRRADKVRKRQVVSIENIFVEGDEAQMDVRVESGTYVKELVHSDEGRTTPSVAEKLGLQCEVVWLDVNDVHAD